MFLVIRCVLTFKGFPCVTTKKLHLRSIIHELLWFLKGDTNIQYLKDHKVRIWDEWADEDGNLGPVYGSQWRSWPTAMVNTLIKLPSNDQIKNNPDSRRLIVSAWNVGEIENMALPHAMRFFSFMLPMANYRVNFIKEVQTSSLGVPFNIASYALLTMMIAQVCNLEVGEFVHTLGDAHLYSNHLEQAELQLSRETKTLPKMKINPEIKNIFEFTIDDFELLNYDPHPHIKGIVAV